jgi:hypothetical protein
MTVPRYEAMRREQNNRCAICRRPPGKRDLHVDHDHDTNVIRGLLCYYCNTGLGNFKDDIALLEKACDYLRKHAGNGKASA